MTRAGDREMHTLFGTKKKKEKKKENESKTELSRSECKLLSEKENIFSYFQELPATSSLHFGERQGESNSIEGLDWPSTSVASARIPQTIN